MMHRKGFLGPVLTRRRPNERAEVDARSGPAGTREAGPVSLDIVKERRGPVPV
jgi:hypothetical protein